MNLAQRIGSNSFFSILTQFIRLLANAVLFIGIARVYGVEAFGQFTTAHTYTIFLATNQPYYFSKQKIAPNIERKSMNYKVQMALA